MMKMTDRWRPSAAMETLRERAKVTAEVRAFFSERQVLEVETPVLSAAGTVDPHIQSMVANTHSPAYCDASAWLHTSPEFAMKRLLCAGSGDIFQLCKVFRAEELGSRHNPEFSLLEWYRVGYSMNDLMSEVEALLRHLVNGRAPLSDTQYVSYQQAFLNAVDIDPLTASAGELLACLQHHDIDVPDGCSRAELLDLSMALLIEPQLPKSAPVFIHHYPADQAALAKIDPNQPETAMRFELFWGGMELANGFQELSDPAEQLSRFEEEQTVRQAAGRDAVPIDQHLIAALNHGLPDCSGVALGVDRLLMVLLGLDEIAEVLSFSAVNS